MAITYPRAFPEPLPFKALTFRLSYDDAQLRSPTRGGQQVVNIAPPQWTMAYETPPLRQAAAEEWEAWVDSLAGGARLFKAVQPLKRFARAYPGGYGGLTRAIGGAFDGTALLDSIVDTRDGLRITELPSGFKLQVGDLVSFPFPPDGQSLHRITEGGTASALGALDIKVAPTIPYAAVAGVNVQLADPWCLAVIEARSVQAPWQTGKRAPLRFAATQVATGWNAALPSPPALVVEALGTTSLKLTFAPVAGATSYQARLRVAGAETWGDAIAVSSGAVIAELDPDTGYEIEARARGAIGFGAWCDAIEAATWPDETLTDAGAALLDDDAETYLKDDAP